MENRLEIAWVRALGRGVGVSHSNRIAGRGEACGDGTALHLDRGCGYRELHLGWDGTAPQTQTQTCVYEVTSERALRVVAMSISWLCSCAANYARGWRWGGWRKGQLPVGPSLFWNQKFNKNEGRQLLKVVKIVNCMLYVFYHNKILENNEKKACITFYLHPYLCE